MIHAIDDNFLPQMIKPQIILHDSILSQIDGLYQEQHRFLTKIYAGSVYTVQCTLCSEYEISVKRYWSILCSPLSSDPSHSPTDEMCTASISYYPSPLEILTMISRREEGIQYTCFTVVEIKHTYSYCTVCSKTFSS